MREERKHKKKRVGIKRNKKVENIKVRDKGVKG